MGVSVVPSHINLAPYEVKKCIIEVSVPDRLTSGIREKQVLKAIPNGDATNTLTLKYTTAVAVPFPYVLSGINDSPSIFT